jgi:hypothetical protein
MLYCRLVMQEKINGSVPATGSAPPIAEEVSSHAAAAISRIDEKSIPEPLLRQVLLHFHRFDSSELSDSRVLESEVKRIVKKLAAKIEQVPPALRTPTEIDLQETHLGTVDPKTAELVHHTYHYLGSPRESGVHLGLYSGKISGEPKLITLVTLSDFDLPHMVDALPAGIGRDQVMVLARLFSFSWCPRNAMSHTLGLTFSWIRKHRPNVRILLTYLDPNLGFRGTIYRATNWFLFGREHKKRYLYLDGEYVTDRAMIRKYGTADLQKLRALLGSRIEKSREPLRPLEVYVYFLYPRDRAQYQGHTVHEFTPPAALVGG